MRLKRITGTQPLTNFSFSEAFLHQINCQMVVKCPASDETTLEQEFGPFDEGELGALDNEDRRVTVDFHPELKTILENECIMKQLIAKSAGPLFRCIQIQSFSPSLMCGSHWRPVATRGDS